MDVIANLISKPFVHILAEARSGSTTLYDAVNQGVGNQWVDRYGNTIDLSEPFKEPSSQPGFAKQLYPHKVNEICDYIIGNPDKVKVMKNILFDVSQFDPEIQQRLFELPAYTIGLSRRNTFEQALSRCLAKITGVYHVEVWYSVLHHYKPATKIDPNLFLEQLNITMARKQQLLDHSHLLDEIIYYEDINFPKQFDSNKFPPKSESIANYAELQDLYHKHKA